MNRLSAALSIALVSLGVAAGSSPALAKSLRAETAAQDRYCLQGRRWGYPGNCQFATYDQCRATASGTNDSCGVNPTYAFREWQVPRR